MLHPELERSLLTLPTDKPLLLLTRHSLRETAKEPNGVPGYDLPLTPEGIVLAEQWGGRLQRPLTRFHSSPVGRCVDTALALARGAGIRDPQIEQTLQLVEPGCYVQDIRRVGPVFLKMGPLAFANHHFNTPLEGLLSPKEGAARLIRHLHAHQPGAGELGVHVTHDTILAAFIYHLLGRREIGDDDWPWMMEGAWLWFDDDRLHWIWRGQPGVLSLDTYL